jgi:isopentenyldiphosphate isomerase
MDEILDIVDAENTVIGQQSRTLIHQQGLRHRSVHILIVNPHQQVFLQKRSPYKTHAPLCWDSATAGHLNTQETYLEAAIRELEEELGIVITAVDLIPLFMTQATPHNGFEFSQIYQLVYYHPRRFTLNTQEIEIAAWFEIEHLNTWLSDYPDRFAGGFSDIWTRAQPLLTRPYYTGRLACI